MERILNITAFYCFTEAKKEGEADMGQIKRINALVEKIKDDRT